MRYAQGGGLTDERRAFREKLRMEAAGPFALGEESAAIAHDLRVNGSRAQILCHRCSDRTTWTLSRIRTLIGRRFYKSYTVQGVAAVLKRHGWSCQGPARRAVERDDAAVAGWVNETWPQVEGPGRRSMSGSSSRTRPASR